MRDGDAARMSNAERMREEYDANHSVVMTQIGSVGVSLASLPSVEDAATSRAALNGRPGRIPELQKLQLLVRGRGAPATNGQAGSRRPSFFSHGRGESAASEDQLFEREVLTWAFSGAQPIGAHIRVEVRARRHDRRLRTRCRRT